ncbi:hypothetical protein [Roseateles sp.]|uniref:hypothetical protein n=1 Tax=Roseateles sp. TaxID=1971397 RepID=UPI0031D4EC70
MLLAMNQAAHRLAPSRSGSSVGRFIGSFIGTSIDTVVGLAVTIALFGPPLAIAAEAVDTSWALRHVDQSTNAAIQDPKMAGTLRALVPRPLRQAVTQDLWGPPDPVRTSGDSVSMSACRPHDCGAKGFLWLDTAHGTAIAATADCDLQRIAGEWKWRACRLSVGSLAYGPDDLPPQARDAVKAWIADRDLEITSARFTGRVGETRALDDSWR